MNPGDLVNYKPNLQKQGYFLHCGSGTYDFAVVASLNPFMLISESGDMVWRSTVKIDDFDVIGKATPDILSAVFARIKSGN